MEYLLKELRDIEFKLKFTKSTIEKSYFEKRRVSLLKDISNEKLKEAGYEKESF